MHFKNLLLETEMLKSTTFLSLAAAAAMTACSVVPEDPEYYARHQAPVYEQPVNASYQTARNSAPAYSATPTSFGGPVACPVGTRPHAGSGTCLLDNPNASLTSETFTGVATPAPSIQQARPIQQAQPPRAVQNVIRATTAPVAPSAYMGTEITRPYSPANYRVKTGDTVYSLARTLCVPVTAIQSQNGLDANFRIQIGQGLNLPASQC